MRVYADGYVARIREALAEVYEAVRHLVGEQAFTELAIAYAEARPSTDYNLSFVGRGLPGFLVGSPLTSRLPFLPDLARLEWLPGSGFHAFDAAPLEPRAITGRSLDEWAAMRVRFHPSVGCLASAWPVLDLWEARQQPRHTINLLLLDRPQQVLVCRHDERVRCDGVSREEADLIAQLLAGRPLGAACERLAEQGRVESLPVAEWFERWMRQGLIVGCERAAVGQEGA